MASIEFNRLAAESVHGNYLEVPLFGSVFELNESTELCGFLQLQNATTLSAVQRPVLLFSNQSCHRAHFYVHLFRLMHQCSHSGVWSVFLVHGVYHYLCNPQCCERLPDNAEAFTCALNLICH